VLSVTDGLFRESCLLVASRFPGVSVEEQLVDSLVYKMILKPEAYDVIVAPNLYGDILSDAAAALVGGLGIMPSANVNKNFALCEPVHGSAPDIQGKGIANPIAAIRAAAMLLRHLHEQDKDLKLANLASAIEQAVTKTIANPDTRTPDMGGKCNTDKVTDAVIANLQGVILAQPY